jgi:hypothetical protein
MNDDLGRRLVFEREGERRQEVGGVTDLEGVGHDLSW